MTAGGRGAAVAARLLEIAGPDLYRRNAFRITGLPTDASNRAVREHRQRVLPKLAVGAPVEAGGTLPLPVPATPDQIRSAFDELGDAQRRIVEELLWFWDTPNADCSCIRSLHQDHDAAVRAHTLALDRELDGRSSSQQEQAACDELWEAAARRWTALLRRAALWDHIRHRIRALDDRRLDESAIDGLRDGLPRALVTPVVDLAARASDPARLAAHAARWGVGQHVVDDLLTEAAAPLLEKVKAATTRAGRQLDAGHPLDAAADLRHTAIPALARLEGLAPQERHRRTATASQRVAVVFNNCATALIGQPGTATTAEIRSLLDAAHGLVVEVASRRTIETNRAGLDGARPAPPGQSRATGGAADTLGVPATEEYQPLGSAGRRRLIGMVSMIGLGFLLIFPGLVFYLFGAVAGIVACVIWAFFQYLFIQATIDVLRR